MRKIVETPPEPESEPVPSPSPSERAGIAASGEGFGGRPAPDACRIAAHVARILGTQAALYDDGGPGGPVAASAEGADLAPALAAWTAPRRRDGPSLVEAGGTRFVAIPVDFGGRPAWLAGIGASAEAPLAQAAAVKALVEDVAARTAGACERVHRLEEENRRMDKAQRLVGVGTLVYDVEEDLLDVSHAACEVLGRREIPGLEELVLTFAPFDRRAVQQAMTGHFGEADSFDFHRDILLPSGERRALRLHGEVERRGTAATRVFCTLQDVTADRLRLEEMRLLAEHDPLTGVSNRTVFERAVAEATRLSDREHLHAALFLVDIDGFKEVNDTYGHPAGDEVLKYVARAVASLTRASDTVLRLAGDEFAVIVSRAANVDGLMGLADRLARALTTRVSVGSASVPLSVSIGVAVYPDDVSPRVDIYKAADHALFAAKAEGKGCVRRFDPRMRAQKESRRLLIARVKEGLRRGEFVPYFQPKLDLVTGCVVGFEALCRWDHPDEGVLLPGSFWEAFDDPEVGGTLSDVTLVGSFCAARRFRERGLPFGHVAINLSRIQLERDHLVDQVRALQEEHGVAAEEVVFEVLENVLIRDERNVYRNLSELYRLGFRVALDDFGTGFASLTHIREPFIREVKIDRSFVTDVASDPSDLQIVAAIVQMARKLGLSLVAEGIEDEETVRRLAALGCTVGQGFVFSKALPIDEAMEFLGRQSRILSLVEGGASDEKEEEGTTVTPLPRRASL